LTLNLVETFFNVMAIEINYWWAGIIVLAAAILITWLIKRDHKDKTDFEKDIIQSELKPKKHDDPIDKTINP
jgi:hypothetical protein